MKRCNNCGWTNNPDSSTHCEKCNNPLTEGRTVDEAAPGGYAAPSGEVNLKGTVMEMGGGGAAAGFAAGMGHGKGNDTPGKRTKRKVDVDEDTQREAGVCPSCGYPLRAGCKVCPSCHTPVSGGHSCSHSSNSSSNHNENTMDEEPPRHNTSVRHCTRCGHANSSNAQFCCECGNPLVEKKAVCSGCGAELNTADRFCPVCGKPRNGAQANPTPDSNQKSNQNNGPVKHNNNAFKSTIPPSQYKPNSITLTALNPYDDPKFEPLELCFGDEETILNREKIEGDNPTISRNQQAVLSLEEGRWYLENKSSLLTTALVLKEKHELKSGDIIMIGNRIFEVTI